MPKQKRPEGLTLRAYQVGFGDCFLLSFHYAAGGDRHVLIDFGSTGFRKGTDVDKRMKDIAADVATACQGKLTAVVATHRHKDHISGFGLEAAGAIIEALEPELVIQPWTEDPEAQEDARKPTAVLKPLQLRPAALNAMQEVAGHALEELARRGKRFTKTAAATLEFVGEDNVKNVAAVRRLIRMGRKTKAAFVHFGSKSGLETLLPGVKTRVLGPPTLEQSAAILRETEEDATEFWQLAAAGGRSLAVGKGRLFARRHVWRRQGLPAEVRWLIPRLDTMRGDQLHELVTILDDAMNNTSVILHFEVGRRRLLFPGDAQIESWSYALAKAAQSAELRKALAGVDVYKVGHHGSRNATPKTLWGMFEHKGMPGVAGRLRSVMSTLKGKHGKTAKTAVPSHSLQAALAAQSDLFSTEDGLKGKQLAEVLRIEV